jgi:manganese/zinc/iron transport system substrate-binding protein
MMMTMTRRGAGLAALWSVALAGLLGIFSLALVGCGDGSDASPPKTNPNTPAAPLSGGGKLKIVATTTMIHDLARRIAGDDADVVGIMKPGEDPHIYDVRPQDAELLRAADLVLMNGLHLEATLIDIAQAQAKPGSVILLAEATGIQPLRSSDAGAADPHLWFNIAHFQQYVRTALAAIIKADPAHAEAYTQRANAYLAELAELDTWTRQQIATIPRDRRAMVTSHDAFQYFGHAYDIDVHAVIGMSTEQQPRPQDLQQLESLVRERNVKALFIETSVSQMLNELVRKLADQTGAKIGGTLYSDSLGDENSPAASYVGMIRHNVTTIVNALK